jgi:hypothetical protein
MDSDLSLDFLRVVEQAAIACAHTMGQGDRHGSDHVAVEAMRKVMDTVPIDGTIVIGEGERDEAPMLYIGEKVGMAHASGEWRASRFPEVDIAVDPLEGTNLCATGAPNAIAVLAASTRGGLLHAPDLYMEKLVVGPSSKNAVSLDAPVEDNLKAMAKAAGTYYSGAGVSSLTFNAGNQLPNGIIFIDTVSGLNIDANGANTTSSSDFASVSLHGNAPADPSGIFRGMIIVAGSLSISGNFHAQGLVYAVNDLVYMGTGTGLIEGAVMSQNIRDVSSTTIDTNTGGNSSIIYNCGYASNPGGQMSQGFNVQPGTYKEVSGS